MVFERPSPRPGTEDDALGRRVAAFLVDLLVVAVAVLLPAAVLAGPEGVGPPDPAAYGLAGLLLLAYLVAFEGSSGQTIGKRLLGIVVVDLEGDPIGYRAALVRTLLHVVDFLPTLYIVGFVLILVTDRWQRVGDIGAGTVVVLTE